MAYIRVGKAWIEVEVQGATAALWAAIAYVEVDEDTYAPAVNDNQSATSVTAYIEQEDISDESLVTSATAYVETDGENYQSVTQVSSYVEQSGLDYYSSATNVSAYVEFSGSNQVQSTSVSSYLEFYGLENVSATTVGAYVEIEPPVTGAGGETYVSVTSLSAYIERTDWPSEIVVSKVVALFGTQDGGASVSQFAVYVEYTTEGLYVTQFGVLIEVDETETNIVPTYFREKTAGPMSLSRLPEEVVGYALDPTYSFWQIIVPEETINLIENPSFETGTHDYSNEIGSWVRVKHPSVGSIAGRYVARRHYQGSSQSVFAGGRAVSAGIYTFSCWVHAPWQFKINLRMYDSGNTVNIAHNQFEVQYTGWHRYSITGTCPGTAVLRCYLEFETGQQECYIYTDAWQLENKGYATTYCDGDMVGYYEEHTDNAYYWIGTPHASSSIRRGFTRSGGKIVSLSDDIHFMTTSIVGLGMSPIDLDTVEMADGSEIYRGAFFRSRQFTITGRIYGTTFMELSRKRELLVNALKPDTTKDNQPLLIYYAPTDKSGDEIVAPVEIQAAYKDGLTGNISNYYTESIPLQFLAVVPQIRSLIRDSSGVSVQQVFDNTGLWIYNIEGVDATVGTLIERGWHNFGGGTSSGYVNDVEWRNDGYLLACGTITQIAGSSPIKQVAEWNPGQDAWQNLGGISGFNSPPIACAYGSGSNHQIPVVFGHFTTVNGNTVRKAAIYNRGTNIWSEMDNGLAGGTGTSFGSAIVPMPNGDFFIFGDFTTDGPGIRTFNYCVKYIAATDSWEQLAEGSNYGLNNIVFDATLGPDGNIYIAGQFTDSTAGFGTASAYCTRWNVQQEQWEALGDGPPLSGGLYGTKVVAGNDGYIYLCAPSGLLWADQIWRWNGASWNKYYEFGERAFTDIDIDPDNNLHLVGGFFSGVAPASTAIQHDKNYIVLSGNVSSNGGFSNEAFTDFYVENWPAGINIDPYGRIALFNTDTSLTSETFQAREITTVTNHGSTAAYPLIKITGPGKIRSIRNFTVDADIQFRDDFAVQEDETLVIDLSGVSPKFYSNFREQIKPALLSGVSSLKKWRLLPGDNQVEVLMLNVNNDTEAWLEWQYTHWSIDPSNL